MSGTVVSDPHLYSQCKGLVNQFVKCESQNKLAKYIGACDSIQISMIKCIKQERGQMRNRNLDKSNERKERLKQIRIETDPNYAQIIKNIGADSPADNSTPSNTKDSYSKYEPYNQ